MNYALSALILIRLDAHLGEWCTVAWLSSHLITPGRVIEPTCDRLVDMGLIQRAFAGGMRCYGAQVTELLAPINDAQGSGPALSTQKTQPQPIGAAP